MAFGEALYVPYSLPVQLLLGQLLVSQHSNIGSIQQWQKAVTTFIVQTDRYQTAYE